MRRQQVEAVQAAAAAPEPPKWLEMAIHRRLIVHTLDGKSIEGTMTLAAEDGVLLWSARLLGNPPVDLGGEVFVPREQVAFVQTVRM